MKMNLFFLVIVIFLDFIWAQNNNQKVNFPYIKIKIGDIEVESLSEDRVYRLSFSKLNSILSSYQRIAIQGVGIENLRLFKGAMQRINVFPNTLNAHSDNLVEVPIEIIDRGSLGTFDDGDEILFFAHGTSEWNPVTPNQSEIPIRFEFENDEYSFYNFYYLDFTSNQLGKRLKVDSTIYNARDTLLSSRFYLRAEKEDHIGHCDISGSYSAEMGKNWFWHSLKDSSCSILVTKNKRLSASDLSFDQGPLTGYQSSDTIYLSFYTFQKNSNDIFDIVLPWGIPTYISNLGLEGAYYKFSNPIDSLFRISYVDWLVQKKDYGFDGYSVIYNKRFVYNNKPFYIFRHQDGSLIYKLGNSIPDLKVLKTSFGLPVSHLYLNNFKVFHDSSLFENNIKYFIYKNSDILDIHSEQIDFVTNASFNQVIRNFNKVTSFINYLIITSENLISGALDYKNYYENQFPNSTVGVVSLQDIYRSFSSGRVSPIAIRDFLRWAYQGWGLNNGNNHLKYVLLYGDACYDYRKISQSRMSENMNDKCLLPTYVEKFSATDDYYGYLDSNESLFTGYSDLDISIGRLPISTLEEAEIYLDKIRNYYNPSNYGFWRNTFLSAADDGTVFGNPGNADYITQGFVNPSEALNYIVQSYDSGKSIIRSYLLNYPHNISYHKPEATQDFINKLNNGSLLVNYLGHGAFDILADEQLFVLDRDITKLSNTYKNFFFLAFSCTVGRFDLVSKNSLSEAFLLSYRTGAIATFAGTRESYNHANIDLARKLYTQLFQSDSFGNYKTIGQAISIAKRQSIDPINSERYNLLGDPSLMIRRPNLFISITQSPDTLSGLHCGSIKGSIQGGSGKGFLILKIFGQNKFKQISSQGEVSFATQNYFENGNLLYSTQVAYENNQFSIPFLLGEKLPFNDTAAFLKIYAWDSITNSEGSQLKSNLIINGIKNNCNIEDKEGPKIYVSGCNRSQSSLVDLGNEVKLPRPYCLEFLLRDSLGSIFLSDNIDEGVFLDIEKEMNGTYVPYLLNQNLVLTEDHFNYKSFHWNIDENFPTGIYLFKIQGEDIFGNVSKRTLKINLVDEQLLHLYKVFNAPNPLKQSGTCFYFGSITNSFGQNIEGNIKIYNQKGILVKVLSQVRPQLLSNYSDAQCRIRNAWWDGKDYRGNILGNGVYFYKVTIRQRSDLGDIKVDKQKGVLIISR